MLKPSKKAGGSPLIAEGKPQHAKAPVTRPNSPLSTRNRVIVTEASGASHKPTFKAPRSDAGGGDATTRGYTKVG